MNVDLFRLYCCIVIVLALVALRLGVKLLRDFLLARETGLVDLVYVDHVRQTKDKIGGTAIVCGGSIAGLLAARVCHSHFERVLLVEPEGWLTRKEAKSANSSLQTPSRARVMQYNTLHGNLSFFYLGVRKLFPGMEAACDEAGIRIAPSDFRSHIWGLPYILPTIIQDTFWASRSATETLIRRLCLDPSVYPNIEQITGTVCGFRFANTDATAISSVEVRAVNNVIETINASLVVDCTGPSQAGIKCLKRALNHDVLPFSTFTSRFDPDMHYSSFIFNFPPDKSYKIPIPGGWDNNPGGIFMLLPEPPNESKFVSAFRNEGNSVVICLGAWGSTPLPDTLDGIKGFVNSILVRRPIPTWFINFLDVCTEVAETVQYSYVRCPPSYWVHFEKMKHLPNNWIACGDSVSQLNPIFASGSSKALLGALALNTVLRHGKGNKLPRTFSQQFFKMQAAKLKRPWMAAKYRDYAYNSTTPEDGEDLTKGALVRKYMWWLQYLAPTDKQIGSLLWHNQHLLAVSIDMFHPKIITKVIYHYFTDV